jgi:tetratricopeptide (TPR) repeat protein/transcriptional regulator with XRE-family HTH domain
MAEEAEFGAELRRLRTAAGVSLSRLSDAIHYSKGYLSKVENGVAQPNHTLAVLCDTELATGGTLVKLVPTIRRKRGRTRAVIRSSALPAPTRHFTGRAETIVALCASDSAVCAIDGMAGTGKTALAVTVAHRIEPEYPDGAVFLDLHGYSQHTRPMSSADALDRLLRMLGVPGEEIPPDPQDRAARYRAHLLGKRVLIVLDNVRSAEQIRLLLPAEPSCRVIVTSRSRLVALDDSSHFTLAALNDADAVRLFRVMTGHDDDALLERIVDQCGRLPLAVRIAAARLRGNPQWTLSELDRRLSDESARLAELDDGERSVAAALHLSYRDLPNEQQRLFGLLGVYPGHDIDATAAAALLDVRPHHARMLLDRLHDAHLVTQHVMDRYEMHDLVRAFASDTASAEIHSEDRQSALLRLIDHTLHALAQADEAISPGRYRPALGLEHLPVTRREIPDREAALAWLAAEGTNLVELCELAHVNGLHDRAWQLAFLQREYFFATKECDAWVRSHLCAVRAAQAAGNGWAEGVTRNNLGLAYLHRGELARAADQYRGARAVFEIVGDDRGITDATANLAWLSHYLGDNATAVDQLRAALEFYERTGARRSVGITLRGMALAHTELGEFDEATRNARAALAVFTELDYGPDIAMTLNCLGWNDFRSGNHDSARRYYQDALDRAARCGSRHEQARAETGLGNLAAAADDATQATLRWRHAEELHPGLDAVVVGEFRARLSYVH